MKRLLALLLLISSAALHAQQLDWTNAVNVPNTVTNSSFEACPNNTQLPTCGPWQEGPGFQPGTWSSNYGSREYVFSYTPGLLFQDIDLTQYETNLFNFTFSFALNNSCRNSIGGSCENVDGPIDAFSAKIYFYDANGLNNEFTFLSGNPSTANIVCNGFDILGLCLLGYSAQDQWQQFGWYSHVQSNSLFTSARVEFTGQDVGFWGGLYGPRLDNVNLTINYMPPPLPTSGGLAGMNVSAPGSDYIFIFKGNDPILFSQLAIKGEDIVGWTAVSTSGEALGITQVTQPDPDYLFLYTDGIPTSGTYYSFQEQPPTVDCVLSPFDPTCIIDTLGIDDGTVDYTDPEQVLASLEDDTTDTTDTGADDGSDDGTEVIEEEEEVLVADEEATDEEVDIEEMLQEEETTDEEEVLVADETTETVSEPAVVATYRELTDEEKAAILADAISKNTLEGALAIASETSSSSSSAAATTTTQSESTSRSSTTQAAVAATVTESSTTIEMRVEEEKTEIVAASDAGADVLETGRLIGREALAVTTSQSEQSAAESVTQAESIAINSSETQTVVAISNETTQTTVTEDTTVVASSKVEEVEDGKREVQQVASDESSSSSTAEIEQQIVAQSESNTEVDTSTAVSDNTSEQVVEDKTEIVAVADTSTIEQTDTFAEIMQLDIKPVTEETDDKDVEFVQQLAVATNEQKQEETNNSGFSEEEKITIASDPALANAFNLAPNINNLEAAGVLNQKQEEKSDAEKRADEVVAANAKEQEDINKNYMDADQSGIVAAMGADTDVSAYRTAMLRDNNNWYKPEDIYKGIIIKDNVRGSYFLEKGNTDTYKKMVEEQYK
jgi:uncharacterized membrane protein